MSIYLDNAATTQLDREVFDEMTPYLLQILVTRRRIMCMAGWLKMLLKMQGKLLPGLLNASPNEIVFTSGGTEADNTAILSSVRSHQIKHVITTPFEHHAVLHTLEVLKITGEIKLSFIDTDNRGNLDINHLDLLKITTGRWYR
jgi:cysteine desulfurase